MDLGLQTLALATLLVFAVSVVFAAMGLGGGLASRPIPDERPPVADDSTDPRSDPAGGGQSTKDSRP